MRFIYPSLLVWGTLIVVPILLYLFRPRPRREKVSTLLFFKSLAREYQESTWMRRLKRLLSLLMSLLVVAMVSSALARLTLSPPAGAAKNVVLLIDRSASMAATDGEGNSRLKEALTAARRHVEGLPGGVPVSVIAYDRRPEILLPPTTDMREVKRTLDEIRVRPIEGDFAKAVSLAERVASLETPARILHATDEMKEAAVPEDPDIEISPISVALPETVNAGITCFQLRRMPMEPARFQAFIQVESAGKKEAEAELEIRVDGSLVAIRRLTLTSEGSEKLLIPVTAGEGNVVSLKVVAEGDALPLDDQVHARIPAMHPLRVLWVSETPGAFTELALTSLGEGGDIEIYQADPSGWPPKEEVDVAILDRWLPKEWHDGISVIILNPPDGTEPIRTVRIEGEGLPVDAVRVAREQHPLLYGVASTRVTLTQTAVFDAGGSLEPVWVGPSGPVLMAGELRGQRMVIMGFDPEKSERLPLMASFPMLVGNGVYWCAEPMLEQYSGHNRRTGDLVAIEGRTVTWSAGGEARSETLQVTGKWIELDRIGLWQSDRGESGSASLLSGRETRYATGAREKARADGAASGLRAAFGGDLGWFLLWATILILAVESYLFHRHAVY